MKSIHSAFPMLLLAAAIQDVHAAATANPDTATVLRNGGAVYIDVLANDTSDNPESEGLYIAYYDTFSANYGSVILEEGTNRLIYQPPEDFVGQDTFFYGADDGLGYGGAVVTIHVVEDMQSAPNSIISGPTNQAVASMLDELCPATWGESPFFQYADACAELYDRLDDSAQLNDALRQIAPEESLTQRGLMMESNRARGARVQQAMARTRAGGPASLSINNHALPLGGSAGDALGSPWTLISAIPYEDFERRESGYESGYDSAAKGLMLGLGYRLSHSISLGGALDWTAYDLDYLGKSGDLKSDLYTLTGFFTWNRNSLGLELQAGYTKGSSRAQRRFTFPETAYADSSYDSAQRNLSAQADWLISKRAWTFQPFLRLDYAHSEVDGWTETGNSLWLMVVEKQTQEQINTSLGLDTRYTRNFDWGVLIPGLKLSLVNQSNLHNSPVAFQLVDADYGYGTFELRTQSPDSLYYQWELNTALVFAGGWSSFLGVQVLSGLDHVSAYQLRAGLNREF
jgi:uncharacterized protein YhjY with autotransporter beta-barrel domain